MTFCWSVGIKINVCTVCSKNGVKKEKNQGMWCDKGGKIQFIPVGLNAVMNLIQNTSKISLVKSSCSFGMEPRRLRDTVSLRFSTEDTWCNDAMIFYFKKNECLLILYSHTLLRPPFKDNFGLPFYNTKWGEQTLHFNLRYRLLTFWQILFCYSAITFTSSSH